MGTLTVMVTRNAARYSPTPAATSQVAGERQRPARRAIAATPRTRAPTRPATLTAFATSRLKLLLGKRSVALNRAALAELGGGRAAGRLRIDDPAEAFQLLYGLVIQDLQIRVLLGEAPPPPDALAAQARTAVDRFLTLTANSAN
jgi:AefR-like transcriptional repressor, C-terminal domain